MAGLSHIEWTQKTWNPVTGCTKVSPGCKNCYAEKFALRLQGARNKRYQNGFKPTVQEDLLELPLKWHHPAMIFVNSMSDLFHDAFSLQVIQSVFHTMNAAKQHIFQVLTKRSERLAKLAPYLSWSENIWMGVSVENEQYTKRIIDLVQVPSSVRFISCEPLLSSIGNLPLKDIDWVIVGGESGPGARKLKEEWVIQIRDLCKINHVPFFFKQWGGVRKKENGRLLEGKLYDEFPCHQKQTEITFSSLR